ncbi:hypothetical protein HDU85_005913 [Gaertneriomyces sp. JEL0708]|nr:hypothetical protein HDU85_005913 [Gaertneriomyces sp. JEL0708]
MPRSASMSSTSTLPYDGAQGSLCESMRKLDIKSSMLVRYNNPDHSDVRIVLNTSDDILYVDRATMGKHSKYFSESRYLANKSAAVHESVKAERYNHDGLDDVPFMVVSRDESEKPEKRTIPTIKSPNDEMDKGKGRDVTTLRTKPDMHTIHLSELGVMDDIFLRIVAWCYFGDSFTLEVSPADIEQYLVAYRILGMNKTFMNALGKEVSKIELTVNNLNRLCDMNPEVIRYSDLLDLSMASLTSEKPGIGVHMLPCYAYKQHVSHAYYDIISIRTDAKLIRNKYGREALVDTFKVLYGALWSVYVEIFKIVIVEIGTTMEDNPGSIMWLVMDPKLGANDIYNLIQFIKAESERRSYEHLVVATDNKHVKRVIHSILHEITCPGFIVSFIDHDQCYHRQQISTMTVSAFKRKVVYTQDCTVRGTRDIHDFSEGCANAVYIETVIPSNLNVCVMVHGYSNIAYYSTEVLKRYSELFQLLHKKYLEYNNRSIQDESNDSNNTQGQIKDKIERQDHESGYGSYDKYVSRRYGHNGELIFFIEVDSFKGYEDIAINVLNWCYSQDEQQIDISLDNVFKYTHVFDAFGMQSKLEDVIARKLGMLKIDSCPDVLDRLCKGFNTKGFRYLSCIPAVGLTGDGLPDEFTINLLILPVHLYRLYDLREWYDIVEIRDEISHHIGRYGSEHILEYLSQVTYKDSDAYEDVMRMAKILYSE